MKSAFGFVRAEGIMSVIPSVSCMHTELGGGGWRAVNLKLVGLVLLGNYQKEVKEASQQF